MIPRVVSSLYLTLKPDGCCPLSPLSLASRLAASLPPFGATSLSVFNSELGVPVIISNVWSIDSTAPRTFAINPDTGYYSIKLDISDQTNQTAAQLQQQLMDLKVHKG